jgi:nucleoside-triphosphatase THEP1
MPEKYSMQISETWLKAAIVGSLWASFEIIIGSFLHNLRIPFAGTILSFASVGLVIAFVQVWKERGLIWKAGLIAALLKSISPSAIILGPMIGIFTEGLIIELFLLLFGRNLLGYIIAGGFAVLSAFFHKVVSLLVTYGFDLVIILDQLYKYIVRQLGMNAGDPVLLISIIMLIYFVVGMLGAILGYLGGKRALAHSSTNVGKLSSQNEGSFFKQDDKVSSSPWYLLYHVFCIICCLYIINILPIYVAVFPALGYAGFCLYWYRTSMRSFRKPSFWIWFMAITILAAVFWNGLSKGSIWDMEGLIIGLKMNLRAIVILTGFAALSRELRNPIIRTVLYHHGFANVYHSVGLAFSVLPGTIESLPGIKVLIRQPVNSLGMIIRQSCDVYPALKEEIKKLSPVIIISGEIQEGKSTFLKEIIPLLKQAGLKLNGMLAEGVHEGQERIGYDLIDVSSGERCIFIRNQFMPGWYKHGKYYFSPEGLSFGKKILEGITNKNTDLIIIDEVGPVELKGKGWAPDIENLLSRHRIPQLWVVRKPLVKKAARQWNIGGLMVIDIGKEEYKNVAEEIIHLVKERHL